MAELFSRIGAAYPKEAQLNALGLTMSRGGHPLFTGLSVVISSGDILWIQGDNGIGKTTLLGALAGLNTPESGELHWTQDDAPCKASQICAYQPHHSYAKASLTTKEDLSFWAGLNGAQSMTEDVLEAVGLALKHNVPTGKLSAGQKRRLALAKLLISQKPIWIMDEPAAAMDKDGIVLIDSLVKQHISKGGAAIIASHSAPRNLSSAARTLTLQANS